MLARLQCCRDIGVGGLNAAHDLRHRADRGVIHDRVKGGNLIGLILLARSYQDGTRLQTVALFQHLIHADADGAKTQNCNFHFDLPL